MKTKLVKRAGTISILTVISRITGLFRDILCAEIFGAGIVWDSFVYAFMVPNLLRRILGEGALASSFIPVYTDVLNNKGEEEADKLLWGLFSFMALFLIVLVIAVDFFVVLALYYLRLPEKLMLILSLVLIVFPYIFFISLTSLVNASLQCRKRFFVSSLTPIILNSIWILTSFAIILLGINKVLGIKLVAVSILFAGLLQLAVSSFYLFAVSGSRFTFSVKGKGKYIKRVLVLMIPASIGYSITQLNTFIDFNLAMFLGEGANSALWYGNRIMQFPLGIFGIAVATALLPTISHHIADSDYESAKRSILFAMRIVFIAVIPAAVGLVALGRPLISLFFQRGAFDAVAVSRSYHTLIAYSIGLFAYSGVKILVSAFYSIKDTKTPVKIGAFCMVINLILNILLMPFLKEAGLALATALSSMVNFLFLFVYLERRVGSIGIKNVFILFVKILSISIIMGIFVIFLYPVFYNVFSSFAGNFLSKLAALLFSILNGIVIYFVLGIFFGVTEFKKSISVLLK